MSEGTATFHVLDIAGPCHTWVKTFGNLHGSQTPLVILHGGPGVYYDYLLPLTDLSVPLVFYDQIGNGRSTHLPEMNGNESFWTMDLFKKELDNLLRHMGLDARPIDLYGHSWGAWQAWIPGAPVYQASKTSFRKPPELLSNEEAEKTGNYSSPGYEAAVELFYQLHLSLARPWPAPEVQAAMK